MENGIILDPTAVFSLGSFRKFLENSLKFLFEFTHDNIILYYLFSVNSVIFFLRVSEVAFNINY